MKINFAMFANSHQTEGKDFPDFKYSKKVDEAWLNGAAMWLRDGKKGQYFSIQIDTKELAGILKAQQEFNKMDDKSIAAIAKL